METFYFSCQSPEAEEMTSAPLKDLRFLHRRWEIRLRRDSPRRLALCRDGPPHWIVGDR